MQLHALQRAAKEPTGAANAAASAMAAASLAGMKRNSSEVPLHVSSVHGPTAFAVVLIAFANAVLAGAAAESDGDEGCTTTGGVTEASP